MRVLVHEERNDRWVRFDFVLEPAPTYRLTSMRMNSPEDPPGAH